MLYKGQHSINHLVKKMYKRLEKMYKVQEFND